jgi:hypothetical protein
MNCSKKCLVVYTWYSDDESVKGVVNDEYKCLEDSKSS